MRDSVTGANIRVVIALPDFDSQFSDAPRGEIDRERYEGLKSASAKVALDLHIAGRIEPDGSIIVKPEHFAR